MLPGDPLVEVIFDLKAVAPLASNKIWEATYHRVYKCNGCHWKFVLLRKLGVYNTVVLFIFEPQFIDNRLNEWGSKYARFRYRILDSDVTR